MDAITKLRSVLQKVQKDLSPEQVMEIGEVLLTLEENKKSPDANVERNRELLLSRSIVGFNKYGVTTERTDLDFDQWLQHLLEELLDAANYVQAIKMQKERDADIVWLAFKAGFEKANERMEVGEEFDVKGNRFILEEPVWNNASDAWLGSKFISKSGTVSRLQKAEQLMREYCTSFNHVRSFPGYLAMDFYETYEKFKKFLNSK